MPNGVIFIPKGGKGMGNYSRVGHIVSPAILLLPLFLILLSAFPSNTPAAVYFVDKNHPQASDSNPGTEALPWRNPWRLNIQTLNPGDIVYVKAGTYVMTPQSWTKWDCPTIHPRQSGTMAEPIVISTFPGDRVTLDIGNQPGAPAIGVCQKYSADYINFNGFAVINAGYRGITIMGSSSKPATGITVQNMTVTQLPMGCTGASCICDNTVGIRIENTANVLVKNNIIHDIRNLCNDNNANGIQIYFSANGIFENNEIYNTETGIYQKIASANAHTYRNNYIHHVSIEGMRLSGSDGQIDNSPTVYQTIIANTPRGISYKTTVTQNNSSFYNNTIANYTGTCFETASAGSTNFKYYNNICYRKGSASEEVLTRDSSNCSGVSGIVSIGNYNLFYRTTGLQFRYGVYGCNQTFTSLSDWQRSGHGLDQNSIGGPASSFDPLFVGPLTNAAGFRLQVNSPALHAGRSDGTSAGSLVNMGAYRNGSECIGVESRCNSSSTPPAQPAGVGILK